LGRKTGIGLLLVGGAVVLHKPRIPRLTTPLLIAFLNSSDVIFFSFVSDFFSTSFLGLTSKLAAVAVVGAAVFVTVVVVAEAVVVLTVGRKCDVGLETSFSGNSVVNAFADVAGAATVAVVVVADAVVVAAAKAVGTNASVSEAVAVTGTVAAVTTTVNGGLEAVVVVVDDDVARAEVAVVVAAIVPPIPDSNAGVIEAFSSAALMDKSLCDFTKSL